MAQNYDYSHLTAFKDEGGHARYPSCPPCSSKILGEIPSIVGFDWDDTLVSTPRYMEYSQFKETIMYYVAHHMPMGELYTILSEDDPMGGWRLPLSRWGDNLQHRKSGVVEILSLLTEHDIPVMLISNKSEPTLMIEVKTVNLDDFFTTIVGHSSDRKPKPYTDSMNAAIKTTSADDDKVWFVGDTPFDWAAANQMGWVSIGINTEYDILPEYNTLMLPWLEENHLEYYDPIMLPICFIDSIEELHNIFVEALAARDRGIAADNTLTSVLEDEEMQDIPSTGILGSCPVCRICTAEV